MPVMKRSYISSILLLVCALIAQPAHAARFVFTDLSRLGLNTSVIDVNNNGLIIGTQGSFPVLLSGTRVTFLHNLVVGGGFQNVVALNDAGLITGLALTQVQGIRRQGPAITFGNGLEFLPVSGLLGSPRDINNAGVVALIITNPNDANGMPVSGNRAAIASSGQRSTLLGDLPGTLMSEALSINNVGQVSGDTFRRLADGSTEITATIWNGLTPTALGTLGGNRSFGRSINDRGQVVGESFIAGNTTTRAFIFSGGILQALPTLEDTRGSAATSINNLGQAVGRTSFNRLNSLDSGTLFENGRAIDLNTVIDQSIFDAGIRIFTASSINDRGRIVGFARNIRNNQLVTFLLTPNAIPEPETWALLLVGFGGIGASLRRRRSQKRTFESAC
jgi:probable HAF family extracellular repeat protein